MYPEMTAGEWEKVESVLKVLKPFADATSFLSAQNHPTLSGAAEVAHVLLETINENKELLGEEARHLYQPQKSPGCLDPAGKSSGRLQRAVG